MSGITVSNAAQLATALASATGGETIFLAGGDYGELRLRNRAFGAAVELVSLDPANQARFSLVTLQNSSNVTFRSLEISHTLAPGAPTFGNMVNITESHNVAFDKIWFHGSLDQDPSNDSGGLAAQHSSHIKVTNSRFEQLGRGALFGSTDHVEVLNNDFHDLRSDGVDFAEVNHVVVYGNRFRDFYAAVGDHPDGIQVWTTGTTRPSTDILIMNNQMFQGVGQGFQGIFLRNGDGLLPFEKVRIINNLIHMNDGNNGLTVINARDVIVDGNTVVSENNDQYTLYIRLEGIVKGEVRNNVSDTILDVRNAELALTGNLRLDQHPGRASEMPDLNRGAAATAGGLTIPTIGYQLPAPGASQEPPRIGTLGDDAFIVGATLQVADLIDGRAGKDIVALQGNYSITLGVQNLIAVETLSLLTGADTRFGDTAGNRYSYSLTTVNDNVAAGTQLIVNASTLLADERLSFDGSAETDGSFLIYAGKGTDVLTGGGGNDVFFFGEDGRFAAGDRVIGGAGNDIVVLRGQYVIAFRADALAGIETVTLNTASDTRFAAAGVNYNYTVATHDNNVAAGATMTFNGARLSATERMVFDGSAEQDGSFRIFGGAANDGLTGGRCADLMYGGLGADLLVGNGGGDTYLFKGAAESSGSGFDRIVGFDCRSDKIDLPFELSGFSGAAAGSLSQGSLDADLAAALGSLLGAGHAILFTATAGDFAGRTFGIVDGNGVAGYQAGADYLIEFVAPAVPVAVGTDFFV